MFIYWIELKWNWVSLHQHIFSMIPAQAKLWQMTLFRSQGRCLRFCSFIGKAGRACQSRRTDTCRKFVFKLLKSHRTPSVRAVPILPSDSHFNLWVKSYWRFYIFLHCNQWVMNFLKWYKGCASNARIVRIKQYYGSCIWMYVLWRRPMSYLVDLEMTAWTSTLSKSIILICKMLVATHILQDACRSKFHFHVFIHLHI